MNTAELFDRKTVLSFEVFPPKRSASIQSIYQALGELKALNPDFISVTYGAGGSANNKDTLDIATAIKKDYQIESIAHLTGLGLSKADVLAQLEAFQAAGIKNILALRGDVPDAPVAKGDFRYASEMIAFIREHGDFNIAAACYPEGHHESPSVLADIQHLKAKTDAGAGHLISQLFFDNERFYRFRERCLLAGIEVPIAAGIMPVVNKKQIERILSLCHVELPKKFTAIMSRYAHNPEALRDAGIAYAVDQIVDLLAHESKGIHLYTMNNPLIAKRICDAIFNLI